MSDDFALIVLIDELNAALAVTRASLQPVRCGVLSLRPETSADLDYSAALYAATRAEELAQVPWPPGAQAAFCRQQFDGQHAHYRQHYPRGHFLIVMEDGADVGRLYVEQTASELRLMEITIQADARNRGIGGTISQTLLTRAHAAGVPMGLHVESFNPARRLYERQGFREIETRGIYLFMRCAPGAAPSPAPQR